MVVSAEYSSESKETFKTMFGDMSQTIEGDTVVKAVDIMIKFQTRQPGFWGESVNDKTATAQRTYAITPSNTPSDAELFDLLKASQEKSSNDLFFKLQLESIKEVIDLLCAVELDKYPTLLANLCQIIREMKDEELFKLIHVYQGIVTSNLSDENQEKIQAMVLLDLPVTSKTAQDLLFVVRQKLNESSSIELYHQGRSYTVS